MQELDNWPADERRRISGVFTDIDDTLTTEGAITLDALEGLAELKAAGLKVVDTAVGRLGALACWEHYNPLARYALMAQHEEIHCAQFPGSMVG